MTAPTSPTVTSSLPIAFIGLGAMGSPMATRLAERQLPVVGYDPRPQAVQRLEAAGGRGAGSAAEAATGAGTMILMVVNADQAEAVLFEAGALEATAPGALVVVMSTCSPNRVVAMAARVEKAGRRFVDAPVSGGIVGAESGSLTIMAAAPTATLAAARPVLDILGSRLFHLGERPGQGAAMKIVNQLLAGIHIAAGAEALAFAERQGIDPALALELLSGSAAASWMLQNRGPRMLAEAPPVASAVDIFVKDLALVLDSGRDARMGLPLAAAAHQLFVASSGLGLGAADDSKVIESYRALSRTSR
jgi:putative dehydrogenase